MTLNVLDTIERFKKDSKPNFWQTFRREVRVFHDGAVAYRGVRVSLGVQTLPPPEIPKALQNRAKLNPILKTVKNC